MTDELRNQPSVTPSTGMGSATMGAHRARVRRAYDRPTLVELGSVRDLTRGASGPNKDAGRRRL